MTTIVTVKTAAHGAQVWGMTLKDGAQVKDEQWRPLGAVLPGSTAEFCVHSGQEIHVRELPPACGFPNPPH